MGTAHVLQQEQPAAGAQHTAHLLQNGRGIGHVAQKEGADYLIEGGIGKGQVVDVGLAQFHHSARPTAAGHRQHIGAGVHRHHAAAGRVER
jgi:curli biogenesis system outer membrane secretion channel CsgG